MKTLIGVLLLIIGATLGLYIGIYLCFWGGIVIMFNSILDGLFWSFIWGFIRFTLSGIIGWGLFLVFAGIGSVFFD